MKHSRTDADVMRVARTLEAETARRRFLRGALGTGASLGLVAMSAGCVSAESPSTCPTSTEFDPLDGVADGALDVTAAKLPYRQHDPKWGADAMWDRDLVIQVATEFEGYSQAEAEELLREFEDGNCIANEGCQLSCFAMILRLLDPSASPTWTPRTLNQAAHERLYYTPSGLSLTTLYADLVAEVTNGAVQLCLKEEYLPGEPGWPSIRASTSALVRAYRTLPPKKRSRFVVMIKTGTYDDTVASHYALIDPDEQGSLDEDDLALLDPAMPLDVTGTFRMSDSASVILEDPDIAAGWEAAGIEATQLGGVWVFARWRDDRERSHLDPLVHAWSSELAKLAGKGA